MQPKEAFKIGFMARCVEMGMSPDETRQLMKTAGEVLTKEAFLKALGEGAKALGKWALPVGALALAAPWAVGGGTAYLANQATDVDATDIEEVKKQELVESYKRMADQLRRQKELRDRKAARKRKDQVFL